MTTKRVVRLSGRLGRILGTVVATFALVAGSSLVAQAKVPGLIYLSASTMVDSIVYKSVRVACPVGTRVVGGFFALEGADGAVVLDDFIPSATDLLVGAGEIVEPGTGNGGTEFSWKITATVACASTLANYVLITSTSAFGQGAARAATARCPSETRLVGGGASLSNGWGHVSIDRLNYTTSTANSVNAHAVSDAGPGGFNEPWSVSAYAICASVTSTVDFNTDKSPSVGITKSDAWICPGTVWSLTTVGWLINPAATNSTDRYITRTTIDIFGTQPVGTAHAIATRPDDTPWILRADIVCVTQM